MCCTKILNNFFIFIFDLCNGSLYSIDEDEYDKICEKNNYSEYEMRKKDLIDDKPFIVNMENKTKYEDIDKNLLQEIVINEYLQYVKKDNQKESEWDVIEN